MNPYRYDVIMYSIQIQLVRYVLHFSGTSYDFKSLGQTIGFELFSFPFLCFHFSSNRGRLLLYLPLSSMLEPPITPRPRCIERSNAFTNFSAACWKGLELSGCNPAIAIMILFDIEAA